MRAQEEGCGLQVVLLPDLGGRPVKRYPHPRKPGYQELGGGAARASLAALHLLHCRAIFITGRNPAKVRALAKEMGAQPLAMEHLTQEQFDLLIHATSAGMWPHTDECFLEADQLNARVVFDLVYNPVETLLLKRARARGCRTISGLEMFVAQAARQFEYWTGLQPPLRLMRQVAVRELERLSLRVQDR